MKSSRPSVRAESRPASVMVGLWSVALFSASVASGHPLSMIRGVARMEDQELALNLTVPATQLDHDERGLNDRDAGVSFDSLRAAATVHAHALLSQLAVRDQGGARLSGRVASIAMPPPRGSALQRDELHRFDITCAFAYVIPQNTRVLSFQLTAPDRAHGSPPAIVLSCQLGKGAGRTIRLTSGGNVEVVNLTSPAVDAPTSRGSAAGPIDSDCRAKYVHHPSATNSVSAIISIEDTSVRLEVIIPVPILETWLPIPRARPDFVERSEQDSVMPAVRRLLTSRIALNIKGTPATPRITRLDFMDAGEMHRQEAAARGPRSAWTAQLYAELTFATAGEPAEGVLHWDLFNSVILNARTLLLANGVCEERDLSTYHPMLTWRRS